MPSADPTLGVEPVAEVLPEARRIMTICNACRYCEGLCAVFPAMERRTVFEDADLRYLASLCHDCRACHYACQYAPPHDFGINVPKTFAALRLESYERFAWPAPLGRAFRRNGLAVALTAGFVAVLVPLLALLLGDPAVLWAVHTGEGAFYAVVPYPLMVAPASTIALLSLVALAIAAARFWRDSGGGRVGVGALLLGSAHAFRLTYLGGDGEGCTYPEDRFSNARKRFHHWVFWGFALDFASTSVAAFYEHVLHVAAPYPLSSPPVVLGTVGGIMIAIGCVGLLWLKRSSDPEPTHAASAGMDVAFLVLLLLTSLTGLALLALRETAAMGMLLVVHLGVVAGFFVTIPYGKLVHAVYRYLALLQSVVEERAEATASLS